MVLRFKHFPLLRNAVVGRRVSNIPGGKQYEGVRFNVITVTRGLAGVNSPGKKPSRNT